MSDRPGRGILPTPVWLVLGGAVGAAIGSGLGGDELGIELVLGGLLGAAIAGGVALVLGQQRRD